jgi:putative transposase
MVANDIEKILSREFVCYGCKKTAKRLNSIGYEMNRKKVRRLIAENYLLNHTYYKRKPITIVVKPILEVTETDWIWELEIKYVWILGEFRNPHLPAMIGCRSGEV